MNIVLKNQVLEQVDYFKYLKTKLPTDGRNALEVRKGIAKEKAAYNKRKILFTKASTYS